MKCPVPPSPARSSPAAPGSRTRLAPPAGRQTRGHRDLDLAGLDGARFRWSRACFTTGAIAGRSVDCISVAQQLLFHSGYQARDIDRRDLALLRRLAGERREGTAGG